MAIPLLFIAAASAVASNYQSNKAEGIAEEQNRVVANKQKIDIVNERRKLYREGRIRQAQLAQQSVNTGVAGSSGQIGAVNNLNASISNQVSNQNMNIGLASYVSNLAGKQQQYQTNSQLFSAASSLAMGAGEQRGEFDQLFSYFNKG